MKKILLMTGLSALSIAAFAEVPEPTSIFDALMQAISPNGKYAVSQGIAGTRIFNLATGEEYTEESENGYDQNEPGLGKSVSDNGIIVASSDNGPVYWKNGEWIKFPIPANATYSNLANAITGDGSRVCGSIGSANMSFDETPTMQVPCFWNAEGDGFGEPVFLPHPDYDFTGSVPQYITAVDISDDGKIIIGQIVDNSGNFAYPILYKENADGEWSYEIPHEELLNPNNLEIVHYPGDGPIMPQYESYMTPAEIAEYQEAYQAWIDSGYQLPCPDYEDFMTAEELEEYTAAAIEYNKNAVEYNEKLYAYLDFMDELRNTIPGYVFNSVRIAADGKTYGCTIRTVGERDPSSWFPKTENAVWVFDMDSKTINKYEEGGDLNLFYLANEGVALAITSPGTPSNSFVCQNGEITDMYSWMNSKVPEYASWMKENMVFPYEEEVYNEELDDYEYVEHEVLMTGRATATPDLSVIALSVQNVWTSMDDGYAFVFDMKAANAVESIRPASEEKTIYDLSGRKLKNASAPGIYIINGEKKVVR